MSAKPTAGRWIVDWDASGFKVCSADGFRIASLPRSSISSGVGEAGEANAALIAEAGTVLHETGLSPRQLADQRAELVAALDDVEAYLAEREDVVDGDYGTPEPNAEMTLLIEVREALAKVRGGAK